MSGEHVGCTKENECAKEDECTKEDECIEDDEDNEENECTEEEECTEDDECTEEDQCTKENECTEDCCAKEDECTEDCCAKEDECTEDCCTKEDCYIPRKVMLGKSPYEQLEYILQHTEISIPDPLLIPQDRLDAILMSPATEIPRMLFERPELASPDALAFPLILDDPDILMITISQMLNILRKHFQSNKDKGRVLEEADVSSPPKETMTNVAPPPDGSSTSSQQHQHDVAVSGPSTVQSSILPPPSQED